MTSKDAVCLSVRPSGTPTGWRGLFFSANCAYCSPMTASTPQSQTCAAPWVDVDLGALRANYAMLSALAPGAVAGAVVKCDAYGLGVAPVAETLAKDMDCETFFVAHAEEGAALRAILAPVKPDARIYVFNGPSPKNLPLYADARLTPVLNSYEQAARWTSHAPGAAAALHIDTGMNRLGAPIDEIERIAALKGLKIEMTMSHLACIADPGHPKNREQRDLFIDAAALFPDAPKSFASSGGALADPAYHFDVLRLGVSLYGGSPFNHDDARISAVASLRAPVIQTREIGAGETVGYGATFTADKPTHLAAVALGYGDGLPWSGSGRARAEIGGRIVPIAGRVSMDLITLDISALDAPPAIGEPATFYGGAISLYEAAAACGAMSYEMLTRLGPRVERRYL